MHGQNHIKYVPIYYTATCVGKDERFARWSVPVWICIRNCKERNLCV